MEFTQDGVFSEERLGQFVVQVPTISSDELGETVKKRFECHAETEGVVVLEHGEPAGIIMRNVLFQKMSSLYGNSLYMRRPASLLMDTSFEKADAEDSISKVGLQTAGRDQSKLYDFIAVYRQHTYLGVISIRQFLIDLSRRNEAQINILKEQQHKLICANEQELKLRKNLEYQSAAVRNLLNHADQGFLWFGGDLTIQSEVSDKCAGIFGRNIGGEQFLDLISGYFLEDQAQVFSLALESYFHQNSPVTDAVYLMLLPADCMIRGKNIHLQYRRIEWHQEKAVMVVMDDITEKVEMEKAMEADRYRQRLLLKAVTCQPQIRRMIEEFRELFSGGFRCFFPEHHDFHTHLEELFRTVHTYKGDFAQYGLGASSERLHLFEDELQSLFSREAESGMSELRELLSRMDADQILGQDLEVISEFLGKGYFDQSELVSVPKPKLLAIEERLSGEDPPDRAEVLELIRKLRRKPVRDCLLPYEDYVEYLCGRVRKSKPDFLVEGDEIEIDEDLYHGLLQSLVHIFRNSMDHGIETEEERLEAGKDPRGQIRCRVERLSGNSFLLLISDDGRGIPLEKLKEKAVSRGLITASQASLMTEEETCGLVFADRLSSKDMTTGLSGRGVGLPAVRDACLKLGGTITAGTRLGQGMTIAMTLPCAPDSSLPSR